MTLSEPDIVNRPSLATPKKTITMPVSAARPDGAQATVVVLGVERGGTSMVAGVVRALGIEMGPRAGLNHEDPLFLTEDHELLKKRIATRNTENATWGFKVPKATMHLEFFESVLRRPVYLVAYRNSLAVADSWMQRGAGQLTGVLQRVQTYQDALLKLYETSSAPILLINYERAVQDGASQAQFVDELIAFLGIGVDSEARDRAISMMTGDGGGYVNLPEHYFAVADARDTRPTTRLELVEANPDPRDAEGWIHHETRKPQLIYRMADGSNLPRRFRLRIDFTHGEGTDSADGSLRLFFRFTEHFINAHCVRPVLRDGLNVLDVETSGHADAMAFGPWETLPMRFKLSVEAATPIEGTAISDSQPQAGQKLPLMARIQNRLKSRIRSGP